MLKKRFFRLILLAAFLIMGALSACQMAVKAEDESLEAGFQNRTALLVDRIADDYTPTEYSDKGKYSFPVVMARMLKYGAQDKSADDYLEEYASGQYEFFHFPFVGMARILGMFPEAHAVKSREEAFLRRILFHDPEYHYNALTGEGTENHISMSRTSGYLFAQRGMQYPDLRERAESWRAQLKPWIMDWSRRIYAYGTGEWDSNPYTAYNLVGWLNLYDFAEDPEVRMAARAVLDYYAANIALKWSQGILGGPESRGSGSYGPLTRTATEYLAWLWFGPTELSENNEFWHRSEYIQAIHGATSTYRPPRQLTDLALKHIPTPSLYHNTKPDYLLTEKAITRETFLIEDSFTQGTAETRLGGWTNASYGVVNWKLVLEHPKMAPALLIGNGGMKSTRSPRGRNPFDQFLQYQNTVVQMTRVPENAEAIEEEVTKAFEAWREEARRDFQLRWDRKHMFHGEHIENSARGSLEKAHLSLVYFWPELPVEVSGNTVYIEYGQTYVAMTTLSGRPAEVQPGKVIDSTERGGIAGFVIEVCSAEGYLSFKDFIQSTRSTPKLAESSRDELAYSYRTEAGDVLEFQYTTEGAWSEMIFDWGYGVESQQVGFNSDEWKQADWPSGEGHGRIARLEVNGVPSEWPENPALINGPQLELRDSILEIHGESTYRVDYSQHRPVFSGEP